MTNPPLMPKATAVWLVENTGLTFRQIADFCHLHELEVKGIADGDVAQGIKGLVAGEADPEYRLKLFESKVSIPTKPRRGPRYTPVSRRQDRPDAIAWLLRNHPELPDAAIIKLVGTTKQTIQSIRDRSHWNATNIKPVDPVTLGLCSQLELDLAVRKAARKSGSAVVESGAPVSTLLPAAETIREAEAGEAEAEGEARDEREPDYNADSVFAKLKPLKRGDDGEE
jgi:uncharacterized protein